MSHYAVESVGKDSYKLAPNDQEDLFDSLTLSFNDKAISAMSIKDVLGQTTVIEFSNIEAHEGVSEQNFNVDLPESVDVIIEQ